ncbi:helix-turn-helix domain-containing protein [Paraburkholderia sp. USG1]|uniref:helix-turn-helix domain-containing protein n=1 Tax=Paraburkholderia sp. USG1 TaxID=2952268 RepID=UPI003862105F
MDPTFEDADQVLACGHRIRSRLWRLQLTLEDVAVSTGISKPFLSQVERGLARPSVRSMIAIARALGISCNYFFDTPGEAHPVRRKEEVQLFRLEGSAASFAG